MTERNVCESEAVTGELFGYGNGLYATDSRMLRQDDVDAGVMHLLRRAYRGQSRFQWFLADVSLLLCRKFPILRLTFAVHDFGTFAFPTSAPAGRKAESDLPTLVNELNYAGMKIGSVQTLYAEVPDSKAEVSACMYEVVAFLSPILQRYRFAAWAHGHAAHSSLLVGMSRTLIDFEQALQRCAASNLPVMITGEFGTDPSTVALALHYGAGNPRAPFVEIRCARTDSDIQKWFAEARGGTLYLNGVESLPQGFQAQLMTHHISRLGQWEIYASQAEQVAGCRIVSSSLMTPQQLVAQRSLPQWMVAELSILQLDLPVFRARRDDLPWVIESAGEAYGVIFSDQDRPSIIDCLCAHDWPENQVELSRFMMRLAVLTQGRVATYDDVVSCADWPISVSARAARSTTANGGASVAGPHAVHDTDFWVKCMLNADSEPMKILPPGLRRAIQHISTNYAQPLSLGDLADVAHVSPSHLSALFKTHVAGNFKSILHRIRVGRAMELLRTEPDLSVTAISMAVGFSDLSHFERYFRQLTGKTPRAYRRDVG